MKKKITSDRYWYLFSNIFHVQPRSLTLKKTNQALLIGEFLKILSIMELRLTIELNS